MIDARELRIGNLIKSFSENPVTVDIFILKMIDNGAHDNWYNPIPLAEQWLLKFGFETADAEMDFMEFEKNNVSICNRGGLNGMKDNPFYYEIGDTFIEKEIKFVHQLQNLYFALTGKELTYVEHSF